MLALLKTPSTRQLTSVFALPAPRVFMRRITLQENPNPMPFYTRWIALSMVGLAMTGPAIATEFCDDKSIDGLSVDADNGDPRCVQRFNSQQTNSGESLPTVRDLSLLSDSAALVAPGRNRLRLSVCGLHTMFDPTVHQSARVTLAEIAFAAPRETSQDPGETTLPLGDEGRILQLSITRELVAGVNRYQLIADWYRTEEPQWSVYGVDSPPMALQMSRVVGSLDASCTVESSTPIVIETDKEDGIGVGLHVLNAEALRMIWSGKFMSTDEITALIPYRIRVGLLHTEYTSNDSRLYLTWWNVQQLQ